jgi:probable rRNA maturation factor
LAKLGCPDAELSIVFVDDPRIQELNRRYLHRDKPTNVLAFSMKEGEFPALHPHLLGDLVISVETAQRQSNRFGLNAGEMVILLMIHGILHLLGYDHEGSKGKPKAHQMAAKQKELLRLVLQRQNKKIES